MFYFLLAFVEWELHSFNAHLFNWKLMVSNPVDSARRWCYRSPPSDMDSSELTALLMQHQRRQMPLIIRSKYCRVRHLRIQSGFFIALMPVSSVKAPASETKVAAATCFQGLSDTPRKRPLASALSKGPVIHAISVCPFCKRYWVASSPPTSLSISMQLIAISDG